jgi:hypothetical protein
MIKTISLTCVMLALYGCAVAGTTPPLFEAGKITNPVMCATDASQTYAVYVPARGNTDALPVIFFFDPHADGALPLTKYKSLADEYGFILIGSNNSKNGNGWPATENIWQQLFSDTQKKLKINNNRVYACGFSGGAKVAGYVALKYNVIKGVVAIGAGLPDGVTAGNFGFSFTGIAGEGDMNMADLVSFCSALDNTTTRHRMIVYGGKHAWAPANIMNLAFTGLQLDAMQQGALAKNDAFITSYIAQSKERLSALSQANELIKAVQECKIAISFLTGLSSEVALFKQKQSSIAGNSAYQRQQQEQQSLFAREQDIKAGYMQQFQQGDMGYWKKTLISLQQQAGAKTAEGMMYQRLLAWLSLAFYSISNQVINGNQNVAARHFVELYKLADPTNSEAWYFSAILDVREQNAQAAENDLLKAVANDFTDTARMEQQPEFKQAKINFAVIESKMKK